MLENDNNQDEDKEKQSKNLPLAVSAGKPPVRTIEEKKGQAGVFFSTDLSFLQALLFSHIFRLKIVTCTWSLFSARIDSAHSLARFLFF